jgi:hypothetical protein
VKTCELLGLSPTRQLLVGKQHACRGLRREAVDGLSAWTSSARQHIPGVAKWNETVPQRLKPNSICGIYGTTKVVPFQNGGEVNSALELHA